MAEDLDTLDILYAMTQTDRTFYTNMRYLDSATRNNVVSLHERNTQLALGLIRSYMNPPPAQQQPARRILFNVDLAGSFLDPVPIYPSAAQIAAAVETRVTVNDTMCAICQESVSLASRIRHCGHCFHGTCIASWFVMSARCPVCRYDIREFTQTPTNNTNDRSVHSD